MESNHIQIPDDDHRTLAIAPKGIFSKGISLPAAYPRLMSCNFSCNPLEFHSHKYFRYIPKQLLANDHIYIIHQPDTCRSFSISHHHLCREIRFVTYGGVLPIIIVVLLAQCFCVFAMCVRQRLPKTLWSGISCLYFHVLCVLFQLQSTNGYGGVWPSVA